jgi:diguanylate cyclase (GGDEF)-like protein
LNQNSFRNKISEEISRSNETKLPMNLVLIALDQYSSLEDSNKKSKVFDYVITKISAQLKNYDTLGRVNDDVIGAIIINKDLNQTKQIFERIRQHMAAQFIDIDKDKVIVTISVGIAMAKPNDTFDGLTLDATAAFHQAQAYSNCIKIFQ